MVERFVHNEPETGPEAPSQEGQPGQQEEQQQQSGASDRPGWLPENFEKPEDLAKSYKELQAAYSKLKQQGGDGQQQEQSQPEEGQEDFKPLDFGGGEGEQQEGQESEDGEGKGEGDEEQVRNTLADAGIDFDELNKEFAEKGELSEDSYKKLTEAGFPKELVDDYVNLKVQNQQTQQAELLEIVGGPQGFNEVADWAQKNLTQDQIDAAEEALQSGNKARMEQALTALKAAKDKATGSRPQLMRGERQSAPSIYRDRSEWLADVGSPKYRESEAFRAEVQAKLARSPNI